MSDRRMPADDDRQLRLRTRKGGLTKFTEDVFFGLLEVAVLALPALLALFAYSSDTIAFAALLGTAAMAVTVGAFRGEWVLLPRPWPEAYAGLVALRFVHYNVGLAAVGFGGAALASATPVVVAGPAVLVAGVLAAATLPATVAGVRALARANRYLFGPVEPPEPPEN